jgi:glycosyltransferase involved in cell wall biosynthesis
MESHLHDPNWSVQTANAGTGNSSWPSVAIIHSFYRSSIPSGENSTARQHFSLLAKAGVDVSLISVSTDDLMNKPGYRARTAANVALGRGMDPAKILGQISPDIVHMHNLFPNIGTQWLQNYGGPIVATLHNYRPACASGLLSRKGKPSCMDCVTGSSLNGIKHGCYHDSGLSTIPVAFRNRKGPLNDAVISRANKLLVPSPLMVEMYQVLGIDSVEVLFQPTQISEVSTNHGKPAQENWVFLGRISKEKGIVELVQNWPPERPLTILGDGPDMPQLIDAAKQVSQNIQIKGFVAESEMVTTLSQASGILVPSTWREGAPGIYADAMFLGVPLIALRGNTVYDMIQHDGTGSTIESLDSTSIELALQDVLSHREQYSARCHEIYTERYSTAEWLNNLKRVYARLI